MKHPDIPSPQSIPADSRISHSAAHVYWNNQPASITGMLGGLPQVSRVDIQGSRNFFAKVQRRSALGKRRRGSEAAVNDPSRGTDEKHRKSSQEGEHHTHSNTFAIDRAVDCGAGIGRVTLSFLSKIAHTVDVVEPIAKFTREISEGEGFAELRREGRVGHIRNIGLEDWTPAKCSYDLIWHQWCLGQLTDVELIAYLKRTKRGLTENGWIGVKENCIIGDVDDFDPDDSAVTRCLSKWREVFKQAELRVELEEVQRGLPKGLYMVRMWALKPL